MTFHCILSNSGYMEIFFLRKYPFCGICFRYMLMIKLPLNKTINSYLKKSTVLCEIEDGLQFTSVEYRFSKWCVFQVLVKYMIHELQISMK